MLPVRWSEACEGTHAPAAAAILQCRTPWPAGRHRGADAVVAAVLPGAIPDSAENLVLGSADGDAAVRADDRVDPRADAGDQAASGDLSFPLHRCAVPRFVPVFAQGGGGVDARMPAARLSDGAGDRARRAGAAQPAADADNPAVLDLVSVAHLCLDRPAEGL